VPAANECGRPCLDLSNAVATASSFYDLYDPVACYPGYAASRAIDCARAIGQPLFNCPGYSSNWYGWLPPDWAPYPQTWTLDLGAATSLDNVVITQNVAAYRTGQYSVDVSADGAAWTNVVSHAVLPLIDSFQQRSAFAPVSARYVRVTVESGPNANGYDTGGLMEVELNCR
jgi:hypothetical protein